MLIVQVSVVVKPEHIVAFREATLANARESVKEPGIARFDVLQQSDDPTRFLLMEVYRTAEDIVRHKETEHYRIWRDRAEPMMAEPRQRIQYENAFPPDAGWG